MASSSRYRGGTDLIWFGKIVKAMYRKVWGFVSTLWTKVVFCANGIKCGSGLRAIGIPSVNVSLGGKAEIGNKFYVRTGIGNTEVGYSGTRIRVGKGGILKIGNRVGVSNATIYCEKSIEIGDDAFVGGGVQIFDTDFHSTDASKRAISPSTGVKTASVSIGNRVFLGANAVICKGVKIGDEAVVGAGSVVTHSVPSGEVWAGNPAAKVR